MRSLVTATLLLVPALAWGQSTTAAPGPVFSIVFNKQPLEVFKAAFLSKLQGVALYQAVVCNTDFTTTGILNGGVVLQAAGAQAGIGHIDRALVEATVNRARQRSKKYIAAELALWGVLLGGALVPGGGVATVGATKIPWLSIAGLVSKKLSDQYDTAGASVASLPWVSAGVDTVTGPRSCYSGLFLGTWNPKAPTSTATASVTGVATVQPLSR